ncbi:MAG: hypothetical protein AAGF83_14185 [Cyanobacteria bacterium P01_G01_bin.67]
MFKVLSHSTYRKLFESALRAIARKNLITALRCQFRTRRYRFLGVCRISL